MKPKQFTLLISGLFFIASPILARSIYCPTFSLYYWNADCVVLAKAKSEEGKNGYEIQQFYKGKETQIPQTFCSCQDVCCIGSYYHEKEYYILFVDKDSLSRSYHIGLAVDTALWRIFFSELEEVYRIQNLEKRHQNYAKWLLKYFQKDNFQGIIREELKEGNGVLFPRIALCRDTMHNLQADHLDCKLPSLFNRRQQYHFLKILNKGQFFLKSAVFIDRLDLISDEDLQKFFYSNCKIFFERLDQENDENAYRGEIMKWGYTFFIDFNHATTNSELEIILSSFCDLVIHHRHMDNRSSVMIKLKEHILENRPMFTDEKEENK